MLPFLDVEVRSNVLRNRMPASWQAASFHLLRIFWAQEFIGSVPIGRSEPYRQMLKAAKRAWQAVGVVCALSLFPMHV